MKITPLANHMHFLEEIAELHQKEWGHLDRSIPLDNRVNVLKRAPNLTGIPAIYIAVEDDILIGSAALVKQDMSTHHPELSPWLAAVFVKPEWRRQGVASRLVKFCEENAIEAKVENLYLFTKFASKLYSKLGWLDFESCKFTGVQVHVMYQKLPLNNRKPCGPTSPDFIVGSSAEYRYDSRSKP